MESYNVLKKERKKKRLLIFTGHDGERDLLVIAKSVFVPG